MNSLNHEPIKIKHEHRLTMMNSCQPIFKDVLWIIAKVSSGTSANQPVAASSGEIAPRGVLGELSPAASSRVALPWIPRRPSRSGVLASSDPPSVTLPVCVRSWTGGWGLHLAVLVQESKRNRYRWSIVVVKPSIQIVVEIIVLLISTSMVIW